jgi:hypothetical protein
MTEEKQEAPQELQTIYIAGPMRGKEYFNFPAFDEARERMIERGWNVISPADLDRNGGFDPEEYESRNMRDNKFQGLPEDFWDRLPGRGYNWDLLECMRRDIAAIQDFADAVLLLPGWESSTGAITEYMLSVWKGIPAFAYPGMEPVTLDQTYFAYGAKSKAKEDNPSEDPLVEAIDITDNSRNQSYGKPEENHGRTAGLWTQYLGLKINARQVCVMNILQKISRDAANPKRDNIVDIAGYVRNIWMVEEGLG